MNAPQATGWWRALSEQRWFIVVFALSALLTSLALTYVYTEKYESRTAISYRVQEVTRFKAQQNEAMGSPAPQPPFKVIGATLQEVLVSDAVLRDVVTTLDLAAKEPVQRSGIWYVQWYRDTKEWLREYGSQAWQLLKYGRVIDDEPVAAAIAELRKNIKVTNRDSYIFNLAVRDKRPDRAARIADHLTSVLAAWLLEFDRQPGRSRLAQLRTVLDQKNEELARRRQEIETLLSQNRVVSVQQDGEKLSDHLYSLQIEVSRLSSDVARAQARLASVDAKLAVKQRLLSALPASMTGQAASAPPLPMPTPALATPAEPAEPPIAPEDFKKLASERVFIDLELRSLNAKRDTLQKTIDDIASRLHKLPGVQSRYDTLKMELASLEREFTQINDAYQEAAVRATSPVSEVRVLHPASVPTTPVTPIKIYHMLLAGGLGLILAIGLVYLLDALGLTLLLAPERRRG